MSALQPPNLDDRTFDQLLDQALEHARRACPQWTDRTPGDPGIVLLEAFAHLTETMIYRLNRLPEKVYVQMLRLLGVKLIPPAAARATLRFSPEKPPLERKVTIPRGTRVTVGRAGAERDAPVFVTIADAELAPRAEHVDVQALHCEVVEAEEVGTTTGQPGQVVFARRPPIIAPSGDALDLIVGVEATEAEAAAAGVTAISHAGKPYLVWREVETFAEVGDSRHAIVADRARGRIEFPPALLLAPGQGRERRSMPTPLGEVPPAGREIRLWYRRGGGAGGNVVTGALSALRDPIAGVRVTNPEPAAGGADAETVENALQRGPYEFRSASRAVTADDYERLARSVPSVARARAFTSTRYWAHAPAGSVDLVLVPAVPLEGGDRSRLTPAMLRERQTEVSREQVQRVVDERRPVGTRCVNARWAKCKALSVVGRVVAFRESDPRRVAEAVTRRLASFINPLPDARGEGGWEFGQGLRVSSVYETILAEPGVRYVDRLTLTVEDAPDGPAKALAGRSLHRPNPWYVGVGEKLYRTTNNGEGWELSATLPGEEVQHVELGEHRPGLAAVLTRVTGEDACRLHVTEDGGESWRRVADTDFHVNDITWVRRATEDVLFIAADNGLYELPLTPKAVPLQLEVAPDKPDLGFTAVAAFTFPLGGGGVAVASRQLRGVYLSLQEGRTRTFQPFGLAQESVDVLEVRSEGPRRFLWAGAGAEPGESGKGCAVRELRESIEAAEDWSWVTKGWDAGSCFSLAFGGDAVYAGTHRRGVLRLRPVERASTWRAPELGCGLPLREQERLLHPVEAVACDEAGRVVLGAGPKGVYRSQDGGETWEKCSGRERTDRVTVTEDALLCSGEHRIECVSEDEVDAERN